VRRPDVTDEILEKVLDRRCSPIGFHLGYKRGRHIALSRFVFLHEGIRREVLPGIGTLPVLQNESAHFYVQMLHEASADQSVLLYDTASGQGLTVEQLPGISIAPVARMKCLALTRS
jgi:hypothetical protein